MCAIESVVQTSAIMLPSNLLSLLFTSPYVYQEAI